MHAVETQMGQPAILQAELNVPGALSALDQVRGFVRGICEDFLFPPPDPEAVTLLEMAVNEATSNIVKHAYGGDGAHDILVEVLAYPDRICVQLRHSGTPFSPGLVPLPLFDGSQTNGFGLYLIARCVDDVTYSRRGGENRICLVKRRPQMPPTHPRNKEADRWN